MKFDIYVVRWVNDQPPHIHKREAGISEGKVDRLFHEVVDENYERLERGRPDFRADFVDEARGVAMCRSFDADVVTVHVFKVRAGLYTQEMIDGHVKEHYGAL